MTVLVGYLAGKCGPAPLHLAVQLARALRRPLTVATVVPRPWATPSPARVDAEYAEWAQRLAAESHAEARAHLTGLGVDELQVDYRQVAHRSVSGGLVEAAREVGADALVLGSAADGHLGQVVLGSTADRLLHSSPVPLAISPRGYRSSPQRTLRRITVGFPGTAESVGVVARVAALTDDLDVPLRVVTFAVRGRTMYPPEVGLHAEDSVLEQWAAQARDTLAALATDGVVAPHVERVVATGNGWPEALDAVDWSDGDLLALGTAARSGLASVFLGSRGAKILRHSPVPVLVLPA